MSVRKIEAEEIDEAMRNATIRREIHLYELDSADGSTLTFLETMKEGRGALPREEILEFLNIAISFHVASSWQDLSFEEQQEKMRQACVEIQTRFRAMAVSLRADLSSKGIAEP